MKVLVALFGNQCALRCLGVVFTLKPVGSGFERTDAQGDFFAGGD
jgi:hypothetical protein